MSCASISGWFTAGIGSCHDELFRRHERTDVARARTHVAMRELEPRARERVGELVGIRVEALRDL